MSVASSQIMRVAGPNPNITYRRSSTLTSRSSVNPPNPETTSIFARWLTPPPVLRSRFSHRMLGALRVARSPVCRPNRSFTAHDSARVTRAPFFSRTGVPGLAVLLSTLVPFALAQSIRKMRPSCLWISQWNLEIACSMSLRTISFFRPPSSETAPMCVTSWSNLNRRPLSSP